MNFYSNENFPLPVVEKLRELGHNVLTIQESRKADQSFPDTDVLAFACEQKRVLLTLNRRHFIRLHQSRPDHFGIIVCKLDKNFEKQAERIDKSTRGKFPWLGSCCVSTENEAAVSSSEISTL